MSRINMNSLSAEKRKALNEALEIIREPAAIALSCEQKYVSFYIGYEHKGGTIRGEIVDNGSCSWIENIYRCPECSEEVGKNSSAVYEKDNPTKYNCENCGSDLYLRKEGFVEKING